MFPKHYYGGRYYGQRYFAQAVGQDPVVGGTGADNLAWYIRRRGWHVRPRLAQR